MVNKRIASWIERYGSVKINLYTENSLIAGRKVGASCGNLDRAKDEQNPQAKNNKSYFHETEGRSIKLLMPLPKKHLADLWRQIY